VFGFALLGVVFFFTPLAMFATGVGPGSSERRALAPFPSDWAHWKVFDEIAVYVNDHLPLRGDATRLRAEVTQDLFGEAPPGGGTLGEHLAHAATDERERSFAKLPPVPTEPTAAGNPDVIIGKDGWLYLTSEFVRECNPEQPPAAVTKGLTRFADILARSGRTLVLTLAPDKSTAEPEHLPDDNPYAACSARAKQETYAALDNAAIPGYLDSRARIDQAEVAENRPYYLRKDTHWNGLAACLVAQDLMRALDPRLLEGTHVEESVKRYTGDLTEILGVASTDQAVDAKIVRNGVDVSRANSLVGAEFQASRTTATSTDAPLVNGPALLIGDSFAEATIPALAPFFQDLTWWHTAGTYEGPRTTAELIKRAKTVLLIWNERYFDYGVLWNNAFLDQLERFLD
jgi:hypothetical protein